MITSTKTVIQHETSVTPEEKRRDGGKALLMELFDDLRGDKRVGKLTAQFSVGGSISSLMFTETESVAQSEIEVSAKNKSANPQSSTNF